MKKVQLEISIEDNKAAESTLLEADKVAGTVHEKNVLKSWQNRVKQLSGNLVQTNKKTEKKKPHYRNARSPSWR